MEFDKSNASVLPGGLPGKTEILVLLCYILKTVNQPVPSSRLRELLHYEGISNYFEVSAAFADLENSGHIKRVDDSEDSFVITPLGIDASDTLESSLSRTVKSRACTATIKMLSRLRHEKETKIEISSPKTGGCIISCSILEGEKELMTVRLQVPTREHAEAVRNIFLDSPEKLYVGVIEIMTNNALNR